MFYFKKKYLNSKGQVTVEYILMAFVVIVLMQLAFKQIKGGGYLDEFTSSPNIVIANMLENGSWSKEPSEARSRHPNHHDRHYSWDP